MGLYVRGALFLRESSREGWFHTPGSTHDKSVPVTEVLYSDGRTHTTVEPNTKLWFFIFDMSSFPPPYPCTLRDSADPPGDCSPGIQNPGPPPTDSIYWLHLCKISGVAAYIPPPSPISPPHPYSVLATMPLLFLAFWDAFLAFPQNHVRRNKNRLLSLLSICVPSPFKSTCQMLICYHIKFVPRQNFSPLPFIPTVKLCTDLSLPIHHPVRLFVTLLYKQPICLSPHRAHVF